MHNHCVVLAIATATFLAASLVSLTSQAQNTFDNAATHQQARYGGKTCFVTHQHYGESPSWPTKKGARRAAIRKWEAFTTWEYGKRWGSYRLARGKRMSCDRSGGRWHCATTAYPCRRR
ncbi:MAG: hypothetical protein AAF732_13765 [Pseudomonadota bacterium]